ncbi:Small subunit (SSU) processome component [Puccinia graminis f. sp. tritici]|uniref:Small subunit (SSU) processome component n=1 Tax=Puccinia graminis f. sp. tritici TaxID=56615 RepID=A0A5B0PI79_PUCGR|nr:Small subunit (SSU) processome component [Puccinia graminis f. sp. tritici]
MAAKAATPKSKGRAPKASNKKLKQEAKNQQEPEKATVSRSPSPSSASSSSDEAPDKNAKSDQNDDQELNVQDETTTQSFADRLKILNLQTDTSNGPIDLNESDDDELPEGLEKEGLANKMLGSKSTKSLNGSLNDTNSINPTTIASIGSFAQTLTQALKSTDTKLLESCFLQQSKNNKNLISNTIQRVPKKLLHTLIEQIVICLNRKKRGYGDGVTVATVRRTKTLVEWVRQILLIHMSYLLTIPTLVTQLSTLQASLQKRLNLHTKLLSLNGRLELVLNQIELNRVSNGSRQLTGSKTLKAIDKKKKKATSVPKQEPYKYVEGESSASEQEAEKSNDDESDGSSDQSDDEDGSDSDQLDQTDSEEEGSVEDVVLGSGSDEEDSEDSEDEEAEGARRLKKLTNGINDLLDLEADESGSEDGSGDEEEEEEEEEEEDDDESMEGFIDDGSEESSEEEDSD